MTQYYSFIKVVLCTTLHIILKEVANLEVNKYSCFGIFLLVPLNKTK